MPVDITRELRKYVPVFQQSYEQNMNEAETSLRIGKFLEDVLGYDVFQDITKEYTVKDRFVDYAIKLNGKVSFFIEIKQANIDLKEKHIEQASNYAANAGISWVALTNGRCWQLYHLTFDDGIQSDLILSADILNEELKEAACKISYLHKKSILKCEHEDYYAKIKALSAKSIIQAIFQENTLRTIRLHLKKATGISVDEQDLVAGIKTMISPEAWESIGEVKIKRKRRVPRTTARPAVENSVIEEIAEPAPDETEPEMQ